MLHLGIVDLDYWVLWYLGQVYHLCFFFVVVVYLELHPQHMKVPRLGVELAPQLPAYTTTTATWDLNRVCDLHHSSRQRRILNPLSEARD